MTGPALAASEPSSWRLLEGLDPGTIALVVGAFLLGGVVKGALGLGMPIVVLSLLALVMPLRSAMAIFLIPGIVSNIWQASSGPHLPALIPRLWTFLLGAVLGIALGVRLLTIADQSVMVDVLGGLLIVYSVFSLAAPRLPAPGRREVWLSPLCGGGGGVLFGMTGIFIVPGLLYLETLRMPRDQFVQALGLTFVVISSALGIGMVGAALISWELAALSALGLAPAFAGIWLGVKLRKRISEAFYRRLFFYALIATGVYMIARS